MSEEKGTKQGQCRPPLFRISHFHEPHASLKQCCSCFKGLFGWFVRCDYYIYSIKRKVDDKIRRGCGMIRQSRRIDDVSSTLGHLFRRRGRQTTAYAQHRRSIHDHDDPTLLWARDNPALAQQCLQPPVWDMKACDPIFSDQKSESLEGYCKWRRWPNVASSKTPNDDESLKEKTLAISSHVLSAPLTLALFTGRNKQVSSKNRFCCVGARAEATIPFDFWKEYLLLRSSSSALVDDNEEVVAHSLDFIGPDIVASSSPGKTTTPDKQVCLDNHGSSLILRWSYKGLLHDLLAKSPSTIDNWDAFVFFNPGFGHPHLKDGWRKTLEQILPLGRPILLTAHSEFDAKRDAELLESRYGIMVKYEKNPFSSRISYPDPFQNDHRVSPNNYVAHLTSAAELTM